MVISSACHWKLIKRQNEEGDDMSADSPFTGKSVAITGKLVNYTRAGIKDRLLELGAHPTASVSKRTSYLIVGENPGSKLDKARMLLLRQLRYRK